MMDSLSSTSDNNIQGGDSSQSNISRVADSDRIEKLELKVSELLKDLCRVKQILNVRDLPPQSNVNLKSHQTTPELDIIGKSIHSPNIGKFIDVDENTWPFKDSHIVKIEDLFSNNVSIIKIQQLKQKTFKGEKVYPVNIYFSSQIQRTKAVDQLRKLCIRRQQRCPTLQHALNGFPQCQNNVKILSKILGEMKEKKLCVAYSISNYSMIEGNKIIPLYTIKVKDGNTFSKEADSRTLDFFRTKESSPRTEESSSQMYYSLRDIIDQHIQDLNTDLVPRPFVRKTVFPSTIPKEIRLKRPAPTHCETIVRKSPRKNSNIPPEADIISNMKPISNPPKDPDITAPPPSMSQPPPSILQPTIPHETQQQKEPIIHTPSTTSDVRIHCAPDYIIYDLDQQNVHDNLQQPLDPDQVVSSSPIYPLQPTQTQWYQKYEIYPYLQETTSSPLVTKD